MTSDADPKEYAMELPLWTVVRRLGDGSRVYAENTVALDFLVFWTIDRTRAVTFLVRDEAEHYASSTADAWVELLP